jgi:flagellar biogenesis protein FliO
MQQLIAVLVVMGLLLRSVQWLRRRGLAHLRRGMRLRRSPRRLEAIERLPLTAQHSLHLVRMDGRSLLIGVSPTGCALLESWKNEPAAGETV